MSAFHAKRHHENAKSTAGRVAMQGVRAMRRRREDFVRASSPYHLSSLQEHPRLAEPDASHVCVAVLLPFIAPSWVLVVHGAATRSV